MSFLTNPIKKLLQEVSNKYSQIEPSISYPIIGSSHLDTFRGNKAPEP